MKKRLWLNLTLLTVMSLYTTIIQAQNLNHQSTNHSLLILGDSLSASYNIPLESGWVNLMTRQMESTYPNVNVINASISGETTGNALKRLPDLLSKYQPEVVVIELGGNDGMRGFKLKDIKNNLEKMIQLSLDSRAKVILTGMHIPPNYGPAYTQVFHNAYRQLAEKYQVKFIPFILKDIGDNPKLMQADGVHPTAEAQPKVLDNMWPHIRDVISQLP